MSDLVRIVTLLGLIIFLLRKNMGIGYVMLITSGALFLLYGMNASEVLLAMKKVISGSITIKLLLSLSLIRIFELVLREQEILAGMMDTVKRSLKSRKAVIISMPLLIGMLPSLGGAYFSAPMVKEATEGSGMSREEKAFINYWFRHPWECVLPLYPGVVFASAVSGVPLNTLLIANAACAATVVITGFILSMRDMSDATPSGEGNRHDQLECRNGKKGLLSFLPIGAVLILVLIVRIELHFSLVAVLIPLFLHYRYGPARILNAVRYGFSPDVLVMIAGIMLFKETMEASGAVKNLSNLMVAHGVPSTPIFCLLPMLAGILTGHTIGFVGSTFPLLISGASHASLPLISLAFASGFIGVLLSPVHLCLILTKEYFNADLQGIYRMTFPAGMIMLAAVLAQYFVLK